MNDNRNYKYKLDLESKRVEYPIISKWIKKGSKVVDLGSGDGTLLRILKDEKKIDGVGVEITSSGVEVAKKRGVFSKKGRIDIKLPFKDKEFDYSICNTTVQMVMYPEVLLREMVRISKKQIVTFPNFAFILNRLEMLFFGRMPKMMLFGYNWFSTGHIHQLSIDDFKDFCADEKIRILAEANMGPGKVFSAISSVLVKVNPNIFATLGIFLLKG